MNILGKEMRTLIKKWFCPPHICKHFKYFYGLRVQVCEECEKEGSKWVALRMCLSCGHVGCCDSSPGIHATKHYETTGHPTMIALPDRSWKWCYIHKQYGE